MRHDILAHFGFIQFEVDNLGLLGETAQHAGDTVVKSHPHGNEYVTRLNRAVGIGFTMHSAHAQTERVAFRNVARA